MSESSRTKDEQAEPGFRPRRGWPIRQEKNKSRRSHHVEITLDQIREALETSWDEKTSYRMTLREGNPAFGQCYPTSRVVQLFFPEVEIVEGEVWTGKSIEKHFWNLLLTDGVEHHIDLTWQQFPDGTEVKNWRVRERESLGDSQETVDRVTLLFERVNRHVCSRR